MGHDQVEVYEDQGHQWRWRRFDSGNHEVLSGPQESFTRKHDAERAARRANPDLFPDDEGEQDGIFVLPSGGDL